jgi:predicted aldo/keto reductase-like oxidoreductase
LVYFQLDYVDLFGLAGINNTEFWDYSIGGGGCLKVTIQL